MRFLEVFKMAAAEGEPPAPPGLIVILLPRKGAPVLGSEGEVSRGAILEHVVSDVRLCPSLVGLQGDQAGLAQ